MGLHGPCQHLPGPGSPEAPVKHGLPALTLSSGLERAAKGGQAAQAFHERQAMLSVPVLPERVD